MTTSDTSKKDTDVRYLRVVLGPLDLGLPPDRIFQMAARRLVNEARAMGMSENQMEKQLEALFSQGGAS